MASRAPRYFLLAFVALWLAALFSVTLRHNEPYPANTLLFFPDIHFTDFTIFDGRFRVWNHATDAFFAVPGFPFTYPAPLLAAFLAYWQFTPHPLAAYLATVLGFAAAGSAVLAWRFPSLRLVLPLSVAGAYPLWFLIDRANIEGLVWIATALGLAAFTARRFTSAAILIGLAASMKIFPAALLLLFLNRVLYRHLATAAVSGAIAMFGSAALVGPSISRALAGISVGMEYFRQTQILSYRGTEIGWDHSLLSIGRQLLRFHFRGESIHGALHAIYLPYLALAAVGFGLLWLQVLRRRPILNQIIALSAASVLFPFISYDYTLVHLLVPFAILMYYLGAERPTLAARDVLGLVLPFAVVFAPLSWLLHGYIGFGGQVKALGLLMLIRAASAVPLPSLLFGEREHPLFFLIRSLPTTESAASSGR